MKVVLRIFIPLCIFSFIAFGISVMFLGTQPITADTAISELTISDQRRKHLRHNRQLHQHKG